MREVETAQARRTAAATIFDKNGVARDITLMAVPDFNDIKINRLPVEQGQACRACARFCSNDNRRSGLGVNVGDKVTVEIDNQRRYELTVAGHSARHLRPPVTTWASKPPVTSPCRR